MCKAVWVAKTGVHQWCGETGTEKRIRDAHTVNDDSVLQRETQLQDAKDHHIAANLPSLAAASEKSWSMDELMDHVKNGPALDDDDASTVNGDGRGPHLFNLLSPTPLLLHRSINLVHTSATGGKSGCYPSTYV